MNVKDRIDHLRLNKGWSLNALAEKIGVSSNTVYSWFNNQKYNPSRKSIEKICEAFEMSLTEFYAEIDSQNLSTQEMLLLDTFRRVPDSLKDKMLKIISLFTNKN